MRQSRIAFIVFSIAVSLCLYTAGLAQISDNYDLQNSVFGSGGGTSTSTNFMVQDIIGQTLGEVSSSDNFRIEDGFAGALISGPVAGDSFEIDDGCYEASLITTNGAKQSHTFHDKGDKDWIRFSASANQTYIIEVNNLNKSQATIDFHDTCEDPFSALGTNAFGTTVRLEWDSGKNGDFYVKLQQFDPDLFGDDSRYEVSVKADNMPPSAPADPRCFSISDTTLGMQWQRSPERDVVKYQVHYSNPSDTDDRVKDVLGADSTYIELKQLTPGVRYGLSVVASDFSGNLSPSSAKVECVATAPPDSSKPTFTLAQPTDAATYTTTANTLTFKGSAQDSGKNLSRVQVSNTKLGVEGWDYSLSGSSDEFRVENVGMAFGDNKIDITAFDAAGNSTKRTINVKRLGEASGAVLIVAGHNETFGLQPNIYYSANRAYRIFKSAGFSDADIHYLAPVLAQDADGDGAPDVDATATPENIEYAIKTWAKEGGKVGKDKPFFVYLIDHGETDIFCANGCVSGAVSPKDLDLWLRTLEDATGLDNVTVILEACRSGSFMDRIGGTDPSLAKAGRVVITSTTRDKNAYASASGAYFSDAFFSCIADSGNLKTCFDQAKASVQVTGMDQAPQLDDNGDGKYLDNDGTIAKSRFVTRYFSSIRPKIIRTSVEKADANGILTAVVEEGAEAMDIVWAAVYPPSFQEPDTVTLNLDVPTVRLEPDPGIPRQYTFNYVNGFTEEGDYRIIFYAQDRTGISAVPKRAGEGPIVYLPLIQSTATGATAGQADAVISQAEDSVDSEEQGDLAEPTEDNLSLPIFLPIIGN